MKKVVITSLAVLLVSPLVAGAQQLDQLTNLVESIRGIVDILIPLVFALAILFFFWGLAQFILAAGDESAASAGKSKMIWGIVAIAVMASIWGLVFFLQDNLGVQQYGAPSVDPLIPKP